MSTTAVQDGVHAAEFGWIGMVREDLQALLAATFPVKPPRAWFGNPGLKSPTPLTVDNTGRVFGHIATWKTSHIGMAGSVRAPKSKSNYAFFATGALECDDGSQVNVGQITMTGGHAPLEASVSQTVAHYDNTDSAAMDVSIGEDKHGIWVAGALRPEITDSQLRRIRASAVSGDWRPINGNLELVAICNVNVPGFPVPRAMVAGGQITALVAAGTQELVQVSIMDHFGMNLEEAITASLGGINERLGNVENALLDKARNRRDQVSDAVERARALAVEQRQVKAVTAAALRASVHAPELWVDGMPMHMTSQECLVASLRDKAKNGLTASAYDNSARSEAVQHKAAMPDGSFPIVSAADFVKAKKSLSLARNRFAAQRHITRRGKSLGLVASK